MVTYRTDMVVERPASDVFPYLADVSHYPKWMGGTSAEPIGAGPMGPGYRYRYRTDEGEFELEVTEYWPNEGFAARTLSGPFHWEGAFRVADEGERRSRVTSEGRVGLRGLMRLAEPFVGGEIRRREHDELVRLKALAEG